MTPLGDIAASGLGMRMNSVNTAMLKPIVMQTSTTLPQHPNSARKAIKKNQTADAKNLKEMLGAKEESKRDYGEDNPSS